MDDLPIKQSGPTLNPIGTFKFDNFVENPPDFENLKAYECIIKQLIL